MEICNSMVAKKCSGVSAGLLLTLQNLLRSVNSVLVDRSYLPTTACLTPYMHCFTADVAIIITNLTP